MKITFTMNAEDTMTTRATIIMTVTCAALFTIATVEPSAAQIQPKGNQPVGPPDSRQVPHPEWTQVSGEIEESQMVAAANDENNVDRLIVKLKAVEGGSIIADLGDAARLHGLELQEKDYIHVRGEMTQRRGAQVLVARELIADGKAITISRDRLRRGPADVSGLIDATSDGEQATPKSPAGPGPRSKPSKP
jgi:hypothetical protein